MPASRTSEVEQLKADPKMAGRGLSPRLPESSRSAEARAPQPGGEISFADALVEASLALSADRDPSEVLDRILLQAQRIYPCRAVALMLLEAGHIWLARHQNLDDGGQALSSLQAGVPLDGLPSLQDACQERRAILVRDCSLLPDWQPLPGLAWLRSMVAAPLPGGPQAAGLLLLLDDEPDSFPPECPHRLQAFAAHAGLAVHRGRWQPQELAEARMADVLCSASLALTETLDLDTVLGTLLDYLAVMVPYDGGNVCLLEPGGRLAPRATRGWEQQPGAQPCQGRTLDAQGRERLGELFSAGTSILIDDRQAHSDWEPCQGLAYAQSGIVVPLMVDNQVMGLCELARRVPGSFGRQHLRWVGALVRQAEVAIRNAQLFEQIRLQRGQLQSLSRHLVEAQENERRLIARELHDEAGQALTSLKVQLKLLERRASQPQAVREGLAELAYRVEGVMANLYRLAAGLRPPSLDHLGLVPALQQYCAAMGEGPGLVVEFEAVGLEGRLPTEMETALYRIVQEALLNVVRHARATRARVVLERCGQRLVALVEDNGQGFDPATAAEKGRLGLLGMCERAESLGGRFRVESAPGGGTRVRVEVPHGD